MKAVAIKKQIYESVQEEGPAPLQRRLASRYLRGSAKSVHAKKELPALKAEEVPQRREPGPKPKGEKITRVSVKEKSRPATDQTAQ